MFEGFAMEVISSDTVNVVGSESKKINLKLWFPSASSCCAKFGVRKYLLVFSGNLL